MMKFMLTASADALAMLAPHATVEAEYGSVTVKGSIKTFAHHGANKGQPCPCSYGNEERIPSDAVDGDIIVGLSHVDLDALGGCLALMGCKPLAPDFWRAAEFADLNGPHKLGHGIEAGIVTLEAFDMLHAWWACSGKIFPPRLPAEPPADLSTLVVDATDFVLDAADTILRITRGDSELLERGRAWYREQRDLNMESFRWIGPDQVIRRSAPKFVNHLYTTPGGLVGLAVVAFNETEGSVTLSFADGPPEGCANARELVQRQWGPLAGGHDNIAGGPRGQTLTWEDAEAFSSVVEQEIHEALAHVG